VSRYEAHINPELMALEHMIYNHMCRSPELRRLLRAQAKSKGSMEVGIKYSMQGRRLSGDMNTACGNAILMILMVGTCMQNVQYPFRIYDDGDDCLLFVPYSNVDEVRERVMTWFLRFGVTLKVEHVARVLEEVQFCQARPVYWGDGVGVLTPNPYKVMSQMYSGVKYGRSPKLDNRLLRTTADCCIHVYHGMPVLHAFHDLVYRSTRVTAKSAYQDGAFEFWANANKAIKHQHSVDDAVRLSFWQAYGISPTEQRLMEESFASKVLTFAPYVKCPVSFDATTWTRVDNCWTDTG
jgi:hypothetical protein